MINAASAAKDLQAIRKRKPLVHSITNYVTMNFTANTLLALGASPVMAHAREEASEMASIASALVLNIGTLSRSWIESMRSAQTNALQRKIPVVLDPAGCGATLYRTETARLLLCEGVTLVRANASEVLALSGQKASTKGVDSTAVPESALEAARALLGQGAQTVCVSGKVDHILSAGPVERIANGHTMMTRVTGTGCAASAACGAFLAVNPNPAQAVAHAMAVLGIAGEIAAENSRGPGSFVPAFLDALYAMTGEQLAAHLKTP